MTYAGDVLELFLLLTLLACGLNFLVGTSGVLFVGHAAFYATGAYCTAVLAGTFGLPPLGAMGAGVALSLLCAFAFSWLTVWLSGHQLMLASLGVCEVWRSVVNCLKLTGGAQGLIVPVPLLRLSWISARTQVVLASVVGVVFFVWLFARLEQSRIGLLFNAMRDDDLLLRETGRSTRTLKRYALALACVPASFAGSLFAHYMGYIDPTSFMLTESLILLMAIMIGGLGTVWGSVLGAAVMVAVPACSRLAQLPPNVVAPLQRIVFALVILVVMGVRPRGMLGRYQLP